MALNWQTFKTRAGTAVIFVAVMLCGLLVNQWSFFLLISIIHFGCWVEYQRITALIDPAYKEITPFHQYGVMLAGWTLLLWFTDDRLTILGIRLHEMGWWIGLLLVFLLPIMELLFTKNIRPKNIAHSLFGLVYISLSWGLMMDLNSELLLSTATHSIGLKANFIPIAIIAAIWVNDTMAYIVGSFIGKTPLSPVSPKKTWEGTIGGVLLSIAVIGLLSYYLFNLENATYHFLIIAAIAAITGTFGDLLESKLKRLAGVKDSGQLMPGHGGFLDRFDSLLLATPFVWLYVQLFMR